MTTPESRLDELLEAYEAECKAGHTPDLAKLCDGDVSLQHALELAIGQLEAFNRQHGIGVLLSDPELTPTQPWQPTSSREGLPQRIGPYQVLELLGQGGQGNVYLCRCPDPPAPVAVKVLGPRATSVLARERFIREKELLAKLRHPGIAQVFDAGVADLGFGPTPYLVMEYIPGQRLSTYVRDHAPPLDKRLRLFVAICEAMEHAHSQGVVHRDLKPGNILIDRWERPKVIDFGVAHVLSPATAAGSVDLEKTIDQPGTLYYMTPEQVTPGMTIDCRSDVYALGVVGFELVTGKLPYAVELDRPWEFPQAIRSESPCAVWKLDRRLPRDLDAILQKALAKEPERRYATMSALAADVERLLDKRPVVARRPSAWYRTRKLVERHQLLTGAVLAVIVALALGWAGTARGLQQARLATEKAQQAAADLALDRGDWNTALTLLGSQANTVAVSTFHKPEKAVWAALNMGQLDSAERLLIALEPQFSLQHRGTWLLLAADLALSKDSDLARGESLAREALAAGGLAESEQWFARGLCASDSLEATHCFEQAVKQDSRNYRAQLSLATARFFLGRYDELRVQTAAMDQLFSQEGAAARLAETATVLQHFSTDSTSMPSSWMPFSFNTTSSVPITSLLDRTVAAALEPTAGKELLAELLAALPRLQAINKPATTLPRLFTRQPNGHTSSRRVLAATRHVPSIARAWSEFEAVLQQHQQLGYCSPELYARMERVTALHPEAMFCFAKGTLAAELPLFGPEVATKLLRSEAAFDEATQAAAILEQVRLDARVQCVAAEFLLGTDHRTRKADPQMKEKALNNIRWLLVHQQLQTRYAESFARNALTLGDPNLAAEVATWLLQQQPKAPAVRLLIAQARLAGGEFPAALQALETILSEEPNHAEALALRHELHTRAAAFVENLAKPSPTTP